MAALGGPIESFSIKGRPFSVAQDSDPPRDLGGKQNTLEMNGDTTARIIQEQVPWKLGPIGLQIDDDKDDQEFLQDVKDSGEFEDCEITYVDGNVYYGSGTLVDATERSAKNIIMDVTLNGQGRLTKQ